MAETTTTRLGLIRWSADTDTPTREDFDTSHAQVEALAAGFLRDELGSRPAASAAYVGFIFEDTDNAGQLYWCDGSAWYGPFHTKTATDALYLLLAGGTMTGVLNMGGNAVQDYAETINALGNSSGTVEPDPADGNWATMTLTGNVTIDLSNLAAGQTIILDITQDGTGSHTVSFTQTVTWSGGTAFAHTGTAASRDRVIIDYDGTTYTGHVAGQAYA